MFRGYAKPTVCFTSYNFFFPLPAPSIFTMPPLEIHGK